MQIENNLKRAKRGQNSMFTKSEVAFKLGQIIKSNRNNNLVLVVPMHLKNRNRIWISL